MMIWIIGVAAILVAGLIVLVIKDNHSKGACSSYDKDTGACYCKMTTKKDCDGNFYKGKDCSFNGMNCSYTPGSPMGACIDPFGNCSVMNKTMCPDKYVFKPYVSCGGAVLTGACIDPLGNCAVVSQDSCIAPLIFKPGQVCETSGACIDPLGNCSVVPQSNCIPPLVFKPNQSCQVVETTGACLDPLGNCSVVKQSACIAPLIFKPGQAC